MKLCLCAALFVAVAATGLSRTGTGAPGEVRVQALLQQSDGPLRKFDGQVLVEATNLVIRTDNAVFCTETSEIQASSDVPIILQNSIEPLWNRARQR